MANTLPPEVSMSPTNFSHKKLLLDCVIYLYIYICINLHIYIKLFLQINLHFKYAYKTDLDRYSYSTHTIVFNITLVLCQHHSLNLLNKLTNVH